MTGECLNQRIAPQTSFFFLREGAPIYPVRKRNTDLPAPSPSSAGDADGCGGARWRRARERTAGRMRAPRDAGEGGGGAAALYRPTAPHRTALTPGLPPVFAPRPPQESCRTSTTSEVMLSIEPRTEARSQRAEAAVIASGARRTTWGSRREPPSARRWRGAALAGVVAGGARGRLGAG